jgi:beta-glucan synthesis-associated protein KRE6
VSQLALLELHMDPTLFVFAFSSIAFCHSPPALQYNPSSSRENAIHSGSRFSAAPSEVSIATEKNGAVAANTVSVPAYLWDTKDPELDDALHNPDPIRDAAIDRSFTIFSFRGWVNVMALVALTMGLITLFLAYPVVAFYRRRELQTPGYNLGGINGTGQVPDLPNMPRLIDPQTPQSAYTRTGTDGKQYNLVFSDEFNIDGRTFWPGDDPYWEAANLHYW